MMDLLEVYKKRRSYYALSKDKIISNKSIEYIVSSCLEHVPSAFNIQSAKVVLLFDGQHEKFWNIVLDTLKKIVSPESFLKTRQKIEDSFKAGYGTILYFDDTSLTKKLQDEFPTYKENFPIWAEHANAMLQFAVWIALTNEGLGCSLQHYNPIIDKEVKSVWSIPEHYKLIAQMPFGKPLDTPNLKSFEAIKKRLKIYK